MTRTGKGKRKGKLIVAVMAITMILGVTAADAGKRRVVKFTNQVSIQLLQNGSSNSAAGAITASKYKCKAFRTVQLYVDPQSKNDPTQFAVIGTVTSNSVGAYVIPIPNLAAADSYFVRIPAKRIFRTRHKIGKCLNATSASIHK